MGLRIVALMLLLLICISVILSVKEQLMKNVRVIIRNFLNFFENLKEISADLNMKGIGETAKNYMLSLMLIMLLLVITFALIKFLIETIT